MAIRAGVRAPPHGAALDRTPPTGDTRLIAALSIPPALPLLGHAPWFWRDTNGFLLRLARAQGDVAVFLSPFVTQRDPRWWPDPDRFDPERWTPEAIAERPRYAAFPFGAGPRSCLGGAMARMVGVLAIATIARRWALHPLPGPAPRIRPILTLKPARALCLRVERAGALPCRARPRRSTLHGHAGLDAPRSARFVLDRP